MITAKRRNDDVAATKFAAHIVVRDERSRNILTSTSGYRNAAAQKNGALIGTGPRVWSGERMAYVIAPVCRSRTEKVHHSI